MEETKRDFKMYVLIFQTIFFAIIIIAAFLIKTFGGNLFLQIREEYILHFEQQTRLEELLGPAPSYSDFDENYTFYSE